MQFIIANARAQKELAEELKNVIFEQLKGDVMVRIPTISYDASVD